MIRTLGFVTKDDVDNEVRAIRKLCQNQHPNVVQVFDYGQLNPDSMIHFIDMELCDISLANYLLGQELSGLASWTTVREQDEIPTHAYNILQQILNGLLYIHCLEEVHRDLSPQNGESHRRFFSLSSVLFKDGGWKIADFGLTSRGTSKKLITTTGARGKQCYRAPELVQEVSTYNNKSDMWSFGCIAFELFTGRKPFSNDIEVWQYTTAKRSPKTYFKGLDNLTKYYINGLLDVDPEKRPSARALLKEKFLMDAPFAEASKAVRPQKRRRTSLVTSSKPSPLLKTSLKWAVTNRQLELILGLVEAGVELKNSLDVYNILEAFHANWNDSSRKQFQRLIDLYPASFWQTQVPGFISKSEVFVHTGELVRFSDLRSSNSLASDTSWPIAPISHFGGNDWHALCIDAFGVFHVDSALLWPGSFGNGLQFTADGKYFASWGTEFAHFCKLTIHSNSTILSLHSVSSHMDLIKVSCIRFTHDCSRVVIAHSCLPGMISVWDLASKQEIQQFQKLDMIISAIDVSQDDTRLVSVGERTFTLWSLETGKIIDTHSLPYDQGESLDIVFFSTDDVALAVSYRSPFLYIWYLKSSDIWIPSQGHHGNITSIARSHTNRQQFLSGSLDKKVKLWAIPQRKPSIQIADYLLSEPELAFIEHIEGVSTVAFSPDDRWIASGSFDGAVRLWDSRDRTLALLLYGRRGSRGSVEFRIMLKIKFLRLHSLYPLGGRSSRSYIMMLHYDFGITVALTEITER